MPEIQLPSVAAENVLEGVLRSRSFASAERRSRLLKFLVEQTVSGHGGNLKEFNIGVEVYGRDPATYDPRIDPVVRVDIGRLRTKLKEYYETEGREDAVRIELPKGSYAIVFNDANPAAREIANRLEPCVAEEIRTPKPARWGPKAYLYAGLTAIVFVVLLSGIYWIAHRPAATSVRHKPDPEAYNLLLKARARRAEGTREAFNQAVIYLNQAIRRDPTYADAYAALAGAYASASVNFAAQPLDYAEKAKAAAETALRLDPTSAHAYVAEGLVDSAVLLNWARGEQELRRAIQLAPQNAAAHSALRLVSLAQGRFDEALAEARKVANLEPLSAAGAVGIGLTYYMARNYKPALAEFLKARDLHPETVATHLFVGMGWEANGEYQKAMAEYQLCVPQMPETKTPIAHLLAVMGKPAEARRLLAEIEQESSGRIFNAFDIACVYAALGDRDEAFQWLDRAYKDRTVGFLKVHPMLDSLRGDPRFAQLLKKSALAG